jgi:hypothetical protein
MGIFDSLTAEIEKLNPANIVKEIESVQADLAVVVARVETLESTLNAWLVTAGPTIAIIEAAIPSITPEVNAALALLKSLAATQASKAV